MSNCGICLERFASHPPVRLPKILPCGHTACISCLLRCSQSSNPPIIRCPIDKKEFPSVDLRNDHLEELITNFALIHDDGEKKGEKVSFSSSSSSSSSECISTMERCEWKNCVNIAAFRCSQCPPGKGQWMCSTHFSFHSSAPMTSDHEVFARETVVTTTSSTSMTPPPETNPKNSKQTIAAAAATTLEKTPSCKCGEEKTSFLCLTCLELICSQCSLTSHHPHARKALASSPKATIISSCKEILTIILKSSNSQSCLLREVHGDAVTNFDNTEERQQFLLDQVDRAEEHLINAVKQAARGWKEQIVQSAHQQEKFGHALVDGLESSLQHSQKLQRDMKIFCNKTLPTYLQQQGEEEGEGDIEQVLASTRRFIDLHEKWKNSQFQPLVMLHNSNNNNDDNDKSLSMGNHFPLHSLSVDAGDVERVASQIAGAVKISTGNSSPSVFSNFPIANREHVSFLATRKKKEEKDARRRVDDDEEEEEEEEEESDDDEDEKRNGSKISSPPPSITTTATTSVGTATTKPAAPSSTILSLPQQPSISSSSPSSPPSSPTYSASLRTRFGKGISSSQPIGIAWTRDGEHVVVVDNRNKRIRILRPDGGGIFREFGSLGKTDGLFKVPYGVAVDKEGNLYVTDIDKQNVQIFSVQGEFLRKFGSQGSGNGQFNSPTGIAVSDLTGEIFVCDGNNNRICVFSNDGNFLRSFGSPSSSSTSHSLLEPWGIALDENDNCYITEVKGNCVSVFSSQGQFSHSFGNIGKSHGGLSFPYGIALEKGSHRRVLVVDKGSDRLQLYHRDGTPYGTLKQGDFRNLFGLAVSDEGRIAVTSCGGNCVWIS